MQACRVLRNSEAATARKGATSIDIVRHTTSLPVGSGGGTVTNAASGSQALNNVKQSQASRERVSILLQKTVSLLPRVLSTAHNAVGPDSSLFWNNVLERSITELSSGSDLPSKATIAVCGFDKWACSHDLITALLEDPFTSDPTYSDILRNRWKNAPSSINIEYGKPAAFAGELSSPSDWFQRFSCAVRLTELPDLSSLSAISDETDSFLLSSDVLLLLWDPVVTPLSDLATRARHLLDRPNTILVLTSGSNSDTHRQVVSKTLSDTGCQPGRVLFVYPGQALGAVTALRASPTSPSTIDRYQKHTLDSRISSIAVAINEILSAKNALGAPLLDLRQETALSQVRGTLFASLRSMEATKGDVDSVATRIDDLSSRVQIIQENTKYEILGQPGREDEIANALSLSAKEMSALLGSLSFWRMVWRVDEIGAVVSAAVRGQWCKGLEHQLILQTGCLELTRRELTNSAFDLLSTTSLHSPVLENLLLQLKHSPTRTLSPSSLTRPVHDRRNQLIQHTTTKLHREAQSAVVGAFGGVLGGAGLGWWLVFGEHILSLGASTEMGTAIGSGALLAVGSIRWAVGKWERAKRRWTDDSARIGEGLTRDLQSTIQRTLVDNVTIVASTACKGMQDLVDRRRDEIHQLHGEVRDLDTELRACSRFFATRPVPTSPSVNEIDIE